MSWFPFCTIFSTRFRDALFAELTSSTDQQIGCALAFLVALTSNRGTVLFSYLRVLVLACIDVCECIDVYSNCKCMFYVFHALLFLILLSLINFAEVLPELLVSSGVLPSESTVIFLSFLLSFFLSFLLSFFLSFFLTLWFIFFVPPLFPSFYSDHCTLLRIFLPCKSSIKMQNISFRCALYLSFPFILFLFPLFFFVFSPFFFSFFFPFFLFFFPPFFSLSYLAALQLAGRHRLVDIVLGVLHIISADATSVSLPIYICICMYEYMYCIGVAYICVEW